MSDDFERIEIIAGRERRRRWSGEAKLGIVEETLTSGDSVSAVARRHGVAPNLLYRWRRLMSEGGAVAVQADDGVTGNGEVRRLEERMRGRTAALLARRGTVRFTMVGAAASVTRSPLSRMGPC
jgi:transposase